MFAGSVNASIISGDFRTEGDLPYCCAAFGGPLVYENIGAAVGPGAELTGANFLSNPSGWGGGVVHMDLDSTTNILTLDSQDDWNFETFDAWISNISFDAGEVITGLSLISGNITDLGITALLGFTGNSIHINYDNVNGFHFTGTQAMFQITADASTEPTSVPEPVSIALLGFGLAGLGFSRKKKTV